MAQPMRAGRKSAISASRVLEYAQSMSVVLVPCTDEFSLRRSHSLNPHNDLEALRPIGLPRLTAGGFDAVEHDIDGGAECTVAAALLDVS